MPFDVLHVRLPHSPVLAGRSVRRAPHRFDVPAVVNDVEAAYHRALAARRLS